MQNALKPPSTTVNVPVTNLEASLANQCNVPNNSSGLPKRPNGVCAMIVLPRSVNEPSSCVNNVRFCSVIKNPGAIALTRKASPNFVANSVAIK